MRISYYVFPDEMALRDCLAAWLAAIGSEDNPDNYSDAVIERNFARTQMCKISTAKKLLKKYGGHAFTEHYERDGGLFEVTPIELVGNNSQFKYNRHL